MTRRNSTPEGGDRDDGDRPPTSVGDDAFGRLASDLRLELLAIVARSEAPPSHSTLLERSSATDAGRLNYHLRRLGGSLLRASDEGYELTQQGRWAHNLLIADVLDGETTREGESIDGPCGHCGAVRVEIAYRGGEGIVTCPSCERTHSAFDFPPGAARRLETEAFVEAYAARTRRFVGLADEGVCPFCAQPTRATLEDWPDPSSPDRGGEPKSCAVRFECSGCTGRIRAPLGLVLSTRPRVRATLSDHGVRLTDAPFWTFEWGVFSASKIQEDDPRRVSLDVPLDDTVWRAVVDADVDLAEWRNVG
ncbi:DUF7351 domain-containing protein [Halovivax limisalsi]|uniref:DUF7351 domain-containing protein n=1 Tax=Halovivax limisalsi TaxID=1453760 RepID=UPI001FFCC8FE|nr:transcriptional regulator [Halovivax limisalsi]